MKVSFLQNGFYERRKQIRHQWKSIITLKSALYKLIIIIIKTKHQVSQGDN